MKQFLATILFFLITSLAFSQERVVLNNNGFIVIDNSAFLIIDNPATTAITTVGSGGNIVSENETDVIKWNIGSNTGNYVIPWTTTSGVKIPLSINKPNAGTGSGSFILSTYETATDMNTPYPSAVTNMNSGLPIVDESLFVADRFWHIDARSYTTKPNVTLVINYNPAANEIGGTNTLIESNLLAQRFNTTLGSWGTALFGVNDAANDRVTGIVIPSADFFEDFILVDKTHPLPVTLVSFDATCSENGIVLNWATQTEINNAYFVLEKSYDALVFFELETVSGAGNSNVLLNYSFIDQLQTSNSQTIYYRLKQVDFDGTVEYHNIIGINCSNTAFEVSQFVMATNQLGFNINTSADEQIEIFLYDYRGRLIANKREQITKGLSVLTLSSLNLSTGIYMLSIIGTRNSFSTKLMKK